MSDKVSVQQVKPEQKNQGLVSSKWNGPRTAEGRQRIAQAQLKHGFYSKAGLKVKHAGGCTEFCVNGLMTGNRRISRSGYDLKHKESSTQRPH